MSIHKNQCCFVGGKSTTDATQSMRILLEKNRNTQRDLHDVFIDLKKTFYRVPRDLIWKAVQAQNILETYVKVIISNGHIAGCKNQVPLYIRRFCRTLNKNQCTLMFNVELNYLTEGLIPNNTHNAFCS